jgi:hypothetical protein
MALQHGEIDDDLSSVVGSGASFFRAADDTPSSAAASALAQSRNNNSNTALSAAIRVRQSLKRESADKLKEEMSADYGEYGGDSDDEAGGDDEDGDDEDGNDEDSDSDSSDDRNGHILYCAVFAVTCLNASAH